MNTIHYAYRRLDKLGDKFNKFKQNQILFSITQNKTQNYEEYKSPVSANI